MTSAISYPPHPAEGRRLSAFVSVPEALTLAAEWPIPPPATASPYNAPVPTASSAHLAGAAPARRQHWLAYDPSAHSQYPVD